MPEIDLPFDLSGCSASWTSAAGDASWSGWLPHLDLAISKSLTARSAEHDQLWPRLEQPGKLTLHAQLRLHYLLRPAVQPGSQVNDELPREQAIVLFRSRAKLSVSSASGSCQRTATDVAEQQFALTVTIDKGVLVPVEVVLETGPGTSLQVDSPHERGFASAPVAAFQNPGSLGQDREADVSLAHQDRARPAALYGGDWRRRRDIFRSAEAQCSKCHSIRGEGGKIGPDLSNLVEAISIRCCVTSHSRARRSIPTM